MHRSSRSRRDHRPPAVAVGVLAVAAALLTVTPTVTTAAAPAPATGDLVGTFAFTAGACSGTVAGSYLRMILPTGTPSGPFLDNGDSTCADKSYTPLTPGSDGGLVTGTHQPAPDPAYDADGHSRAARINQPVGFFGVRFSTSTNARDLQSGEPTRVPTLRADGGRVTGNLASVVATWNRQAFNQGSPKPDGSRPGNTTPVSGTYDAATQRFSITWTSQIVGGPFNDFTGLWHLEGTFRPAGSTAPSGSASAPVPAAPPGSSAGSPTASGTPSPLDPAASAGSAASDGATSTSVESGVGHAAGVRDERAIASTEELRDGWRAPTWLVLVTAALALGAVSVVFRPRRRVDA